MRKVVKRQATMTGHQAVATHLFLDTMIYLHYRPLQDIEWTVVVAARPLEILVPRITIRELDRQKNTHPLQTIRERASRVLKQLEPSFLEGAPEIRDGASIRYHSAVPNVAAMGLDLDPNWPDDILVATILEFRNRMTDATPVLITQDTGPRLTALQHGLRVESLPDDLKLPSAATALEKENQELRQHVLRLQARVPKLTLQFADSETPTVLRASVKPDQPLPTAEFEKRIAALAQQYQRLNAVGTAAFALAGSEEYDRYNREREQYLEEYRRFLNGSVHARNALLRTVKIVLQLGNDGWAPAEDIDIDLHFPLDARVSAKAPSPPEEPAPPRKPQSIFELTMRQTFSPPTLDYSVLEGLGPQPNISSPRIRRSKSYDVNFHVQYVKHGLAERLPPVYLTFRTFEEATSFGLTYSIKAANVPEPGDGRLDIVVVKD